MKITCQRRRSHALARFATVLAAMLFLMAMGGCGGTTGAPAPAAPAPAPTALPPAATAVPATATLTPSPSFTPAATQALRPATETPPPATETPLPAPTATALPAASPAPTATPAPVAPQARAAGKAVNLRSGPGAVYPAVGQLGAGQAQPITGKNAAGDWWQVCCVAGQKAWVSAAVVAAEGASAAVAAIAVAADIPPAPPTAAPQALAPTAAPAATAPPAVLPAQCGPWHKQPAPGHGILLIENHLGQAVSLSGVTQTGEWPLPGKENDVPGRWWMELPVGHHEFIYRTPTQSHYYIHGNISVNVEDGQSYVSPLVLNERFNDYVYPLEIPEGCR